MDDFDVAFTTPTEEAFSHAALVHDQRGDDLLGSLANLQPVFEQPLLPVRGATTVAYRFDGGVLQETSVRPT